MGVSGGVPTRFEDPERLGCDCQRCPLGPRSPFRDGSTKWRPVPVEGESDTLLLVTAPTLGDTKKGYPLRDKRGVLLTEAVNKTPDHKRSSIAWGTVLGCPIPGDDWSTFEARLRSLNRKRRRQDKGEIPSPFECCAPRIERILHESDKVIAVGSTPYKAITGQKASVLDVRGTVSYAQVHARDELGERYAKTVQLAPTMSNFLHRMRWLSIVRLDILRGLLWFKGQLPWKDPRITISQDPKEVRAFFDRNRGDLVYDLETDGVRPLTTQVRCVGFGSPDESIIVPLYDLDGSPLWNDTSLKQVTRYLSDRLQDPKYTWWGHNAGYFDRLVWESFTERTLGERRTPRLTHDTVLISSIIMPEHPKTLAFCVTVHSTEGTPAWKADHTAVTARNMKELAVYCGMDTVLNRRIGPRMYEQVKKKNQELPYRVLIGMQGVCADFHRAGLPVNVKKAARMRQWCQAAEHHHLKIVRDALAATDTTVEGYGKPKRKGDPCYFNPNSPDHLRDVLFGTWGLSPPDSMPARDIFTASGDYSVAKKVLIELSYASQLNEAMRNFMRSLLVYKKWSKRRSTLEAWVPRHWKGATYAGDPGASRVLLEGSYRKIKRADGSHVRVPVYVGHVDPRTGRIHASWNAHGTNVSRLSCSGPNLLNIESPFRELVEAPEGYVFVYADWSALHLRLIAAYWGVPRLIEASTKDLDPHALMCGIIFGNKFWNAPGHPDPQRRAAMGDYKGAAKKMRTPIKAFQYAMGYKAAPPTIFRVMASQMKDDGTRAFPDLRPEQIEAFHDITLKREPQWEHNWERLESTWKQMGYIAEPVNGRRCWFEDGYVIDGIFASDDEEDDQRIGGNVGNQIINFEILGAEGSFASNVTLDFVSKVPADYAGPGTGLVHQNYDSLLALVPEHDAKRVAAIMEECMNRTIKGIPMKADATIGKTWRAAAGA